MLKLYKCSFCTKAARLVFQRLLRFSFYRFSQKNPRALKHQPLKRARSDGTEPVDVTTTEARARMDRAFTMPQFVTSVGGYGGSARAKKVRVEP